LEGNVNNKSQDASYTSNNPKPFLKQACKGKNGMQWTTQYFIRFLNEPKNFFLTLEIVFGDTWQAFIIWG
jgi:hypothetical protein